jgi:transposase-like protein
MPILSEQQVRAYFRKSNRTCPFCESPNINTDDRGDSDWNACSSCGHDWFDEKIKPRRITVTHLSHVITYKTGGQT